MQQGRRIGVVGLGNMGGRIARHLVDSGHAVLGYDPAAGAAEAAGATAAASPAAVLFDSDVVLLSLPDGKVVEAAASGDDGLLAGAHEGAVVIDLSTAAPDSSRRLHGRFAERGVRFVDAGVSGGAKAAAAGRLTIMAGGDPDALDGLDWLFDVIASRVWLMGGPGAGHTTKLINNFLNAVTLAATAEAMVAARKADLDLHRLLEVVNASSGASFASRERFPHIVDGDYLEGGLTSDLMTKDVALYVDLLGQLGVPSLNAAGPLAAFGLATNLGYGDQISNRVVDAIGDVAGDVRLHDSSEPTT